MVKQIEKYNNVTVGNNPYGIAVNSITNIVYVTNMLILILSLL